MFSTYTLDTEELTPQFVEVLRQAYPRKRIEIFVQEARDETEYLLGDPGLMKAVGDVRAGENLVAVSLDGLP